MTKQKSIISEIISRKIPQIIGMYIASAWLAMEISDWMSDRFALTEQLSTYVFVGMMTFLPTVILLAWGHGKPGKDEWSSIEKIFVPVNILASVFALMYLVNPIINEKNAKKIVNVPDGNQETKSQTPQTVMKKMSVVDVETGSEVTYEVAKQVYNQKVISYFWDNKTGDENLDWLSYGASWLLSQDLKRTPVISVITPYDSKSLLHQLTDKGFKNGLSVPMSLARKVADSRSVKWMIRGSFSKTNEQLSLTVNLYDVKTGEMVKTITATNKNWLTALDLLSNDIGEFILSSTNISNNIIPQLAIVEHTSNSIDAIKHVITAINLVAFENDFDSALEHISQALKIDPVFAEAHILSMKYYLNLGDFPKAIEQAEKALDLDYKLYQESVFLVKANLFSMQNGQQRKSVKVLENWVKLYPNSAEALSILGGNYIQIGNHQEQAKEVYQKLYELEGPGHSSLINLAKIYRLQNNKDKALEFLSKYLDANPTKGKAYFELADAYKQFAMFDKAKEMYEEASLYDNKNHQAEIGLANIVASKGNYTLALSQLQSLSDASKTDQPKLNIINSMIEILLHTGQINTAMDISKQLIEPAKRTMSPLNYTFSIKSIDIIYLTSLGQFEKAHKLVDELKLELKPPFDKLAHSFSKLIYAYQHDEENFRADVDILEGFMKNLNMLTLEPEILSSKAKLAYWDKDFEKSLQLYNQALNVTTQSFVTLITTRQINDLTYEKANVLISLKKHQAAIENLNIILTRTPLYAKAHYLKAKAYHQLNDTNNRDESLKQAHLIWKKADAEFLDFKELVVFEKSLNSQ